MKNFSKEGMTVISASRNRQNRNELDFEIVFDQSPNFIGEYNRRMYAGTGKHAGELFVRIAGCRIFFTEDSNGNFEVKDIERYEEFNFQRFRGRKRTRKNGGEQEQQPKQQQKQPQKQQPKRGRAKLKEAIEQRKQEQPEHPEFEEKDKELEQQQAEPEDKSWREILKLCLTNGIPVYLAGPAGCGKSYAVADICTEMDWDFYSTSAVQQEFKLDGFIDAMGDYQPTEFYKACTSEKECVYFIDEMDASIPEVLTKLNMAIANFYHEFPTERVEFDPEKVHFVAAGNTVGNGADDLYTGRAVLDAATLNRFVTVHCDYERDVEEKLAKGDTDLVDFIEGLREAAERTGVRTVFSYRQIQQAARMSGVLNKKQIIQTCIVGTLDDDTIRTLYTFKGGAWQEAFEAIKAA